jgi:ABC-type iron transport system FetAB ATPase subunit
LLLRAIVDLDPNQGEVWLGGLARSTVTAPQWRRRCVYVAAESHWWADTVRPHAKTWSNDLLAQLGFDGSVLDWDIARLSSGEKQRLALARALGLSPGALLLDEPTANLDKSNTAKVEAIVAACRVRHEMPILWVSHDLDQRQRIGQRCARVAEHRVCEEPCNPAQ